MRLVAKDRHGVERELCLVDMGITDEHFRTMVTVGHAFFTYVSSPIIGEAPLVIRMNEDVYAVREAGFTDLREADSGDPVPDHIGAI